MYIKNTYRYKGIIEVERVHSGRYGKRTPPGERKHPTTEEMQKINERQCIKKLRRKIQANFEEGDLYLTLTYKRECRPDAAEARRRVKKLLNKLREIWKKEGQPLKYIIVTEYMNVSIHHHMVLNDLPDGTGPKRVNQIWKEQGGSHNEYLYEEGHYERLAAYLVKETNKTFRKPGNPSRVRYSCSRNLINPKPETRIMKRDDWPEEPRVPKGYHLEKDSLHNGIDKRGYRYQYYRLICLKPKRDFHSVKTESRADFEKGKKGHGDKRKKSLHKSERNERNKKDGPQAVRRKDE